MSARRLVVPTGVMLTGCSGPMSTLDPAGPAAARIAELSWLFMAVTLVPALLVIGLVL